MKKRKKTQKNAKKHRKTSKNIENHKKRQKYITKCLSNGTVGVPWARFGRSWTLLGRSWTLLGRPWGALGTLLGLLEASWTPLARVLRKSLGATYLLEPNLGPKIHPSCLQNPLKIDVKKQIDFETIFSCFCFDVLHRFSLQSKNVNFVKTAFSPEKVTIFALLTSS